MYNELLFACKELMKKKETKNLYAESQLHKIQSFLKNGVPPVTLKYTKVDLHKKWTDKYGWKAKYDNGNLDLCRLTLYRSKKFIDEFGDKPLEARRPVLDGEKKKYHIHIEHVVPSTQLMDNLLREYQKETIKSTWSIQELNNRLLKYSVCTAITWDEKKSLEQNNKSHYSDHFDGAPFQRYLNHNKDAAESNKIIIIDLVNDSKELGMENFTFQDHVQNLKKLSQIVEYPNLFFMNKF